MGTRDLLEDRGCRNRADLLSVRCAAVDRAGDAPVAGGDGYPCLDELRRCGGILYGPVFRGKRYFRSCLKFGNLIRISIELLAFEVTIDSINKYWNFRVNQNITFKLS